MRRFVTSLHELADLPPRHLLLLYSGGVDDSFLLKILSGRGMRHRAWPSLRPHRAGLSSLEAEVSLRPLAESVDAGLRSRDNLARNGERTDEGR
jgi:hypothetical protein